MSATNTVCISLKRGTGHFWMDNGLVALAHGMGEGEHPVDQVLSWLQDRLLEKTGGKGLYFERASGELREYEKRNWVYPVNLFIKVPGDFGQKESVNGREYGTKPPTYKLRLELSRKQATCDICREVGPTTDAKMWMFPFLVDPNKFANFYPGLKRGAKLCARCVLAGLAGYLGWFWKAQGQDALHFFVFHSELKYLEGLQREVLKPLREKCQRKGGNAPAAFSGPYVHETALGLLLELFSHARSSDVLGVKGRQMLAELLDATVAAPPPVTLYAISGKPAQAFNMTVFREFGRLHDLFRLYDEWLKAVSSMDIEPHQLVVRVFEQFEAKHDESRDGAHAGGAAHKAGFEAKDGKSRESLWRDRIAWAVLTFDDPFPFIEQFLYDVRAREQNPRPLVRGTLKVFEYYARKVIDMNEQFQRILAGFGHNLGKAAQEHEEMGILYELRNAKNPEAFYRVLNDVQFRLKMTIPEVLLRIGKGERIDGVPWVRVKTLLAIYAMNAFLGKKDKDGDSGPLGVGGEETKEEEE